MEQSILAKNSRTVRYSADSAVAAALFVASAATAVWQNLRLTILWDTSYILENATRIAAGDVPYRGFPFPFAPLTFEVQAAIIRLFGRAYWHHIAYAALACGAASALTYCVVCQIVGRRLAAILSAPLALLGIYCIVPVPFYDPDCCLAIVAILATILIADDSLLAGAICVVPLLIKQNIGLAFVAAALILFLFQRLWRSLAGLFIGLALSALVIAIVFGASNYIRWTVQFATARRLPSASLLLSIYNDSDLWWWVAVSLIAMIFRHARWLIVVPFLWSEYQFFFSDDPTEAEINFLRFWPLFLVLGLAVVAQTLLSVQRRQECLRHTMLALLIIAAVHGAFLSQITWGSTYGIWPLLIILIAIVFGAVERPLLPAVIVGAVLVHFGAWYVWNNNRLTYVKWNEGEMHMSSLAPLRGMHMRGEWLPEFEELIAYTNAHIPPRDAILCLPGEDLFYFTTGRRPRVAVLMFDHTVNPYSPEQISAFDVQWVIVKRRLQVNGDPFPELGRTLQLLQPHLKLAARLRNYEIYRRVSASASNSSAICCVDGRGTVIVSNRASSGSKTPR